MDELAQYISSNKEWIFSGVGVAVLTGIGGGVLALLLWLLRTIIYKPEQASVSQKIRSGSDSENIQAGRDVQVNDGLKKSDLE